jgi:hypothetical protein
MLLELSLKLDMGSEDLPAPQDIGALLVLILQHEDLGFSPKDHLYSVALNITCIRAHFVLKKVQSTLPFPNRPEGGCQMSESLPITLTFFSSTHQVPPILECRHIGTKFPP